MRFLPGRLLFGDITKSYQADSNTAGPVTLNAADTPIISLNVPDCAVGDVLFVSTMLAAVKSLIAGNVDFHLSIDGAGAQGAFPNGDISMHAHQNVPASGTWRGTMFGVVIVTTAGTMTLNLAGASAGSNATVGQDSAAISVVAFSG
jgi:hypothetical protein